MSNGRFAINIHILTLLATAKKQWLSSGFIANSININPVLVRKEISCLRKVGIVKSKEGKNGGCQLAKKADEILLSEVYKNVNEKSLIGFSKNEPNLKCPIGKQINKHLNTLFLEAENSMLKKLGNITLEQFVDKFS